MGEENSIYKETFDAIKSIYDYKLNRTTTRRYQLNLVLVIAGVLSLAFLNLYYNDKSKPWYLVGVLIVLLYAISLYHIFPKKQLRPWYNIEDYEKIEKGESHVSDIYKELNYTMYLLVHRQRDKYDKGERRDIIISIYLIICISASLISILFLNNLEFFLSFPLILVSFGLLFFYLYHRFEKGIKVEVEEYNKKVEDYMNADKKEKEISNKEIINKLLEIERLIGDQERSQVRNAIVNIGFAVFVFGLSVFIVGSSMLVNLLKIEDLLRGSINFIISGILILLIGFLIMFLSNRISEYNLKKSKNK